MRISSVLLPCGEREYRSGPVYTTLNGEIELVCSGYMSDDLNAVISDAFGNAQFRHDRLALVKQVQAWPESFNHSERSN